MTKELLATLGFGIGSSGSTFTGITSFGIVCNFGAGGGGDDKDENGYSKSSSLYTTPDGEPTHSVEEWAEHYDGKTWQQIVTDEKGTYGDGYQRIKVLGIIVLKATYGPVKDWRYVKMDDSRILDMRHVL